MQIREVLEEAVGWYCQVPGRQYLLEAFYLTVGQMTEAFPGSRVRGGQEGDGDLKTRSCSSRKGRRLQANLTNPPHQKWALGRACRQDRGPPQQPMDPAQGTGL